jgi:hypothetical protein
MEYLKEGQRRMAMTKGFNPRTMEWKESIEKSVGRRSRTDLESKTMQKIQKMLKSKKRS